MAYGPPPMLIATTPHDRAPGCTVQEVPWDTLAASLAESLETPSKTEGVPLWYPATWRDPENRYGIAPAGAYVPSRGKASTLGVTAAVVDFDDAQPQHLETAIRTVQRLGVAAVLHTTWSHGLPGKGRRFRLVLPWASTVPAGVWSSVWARLAAMFPGCDTQCSDPSRGYYAPSHHPGTRPLCFTFTGRPLQIGDLPETPDALPGGASTPLTVATLQRMAQTLKRATQPALVALLRPMEALANGAAYATPGDRHDVTRALTWYLVQRYPHLDPQATAELFSASLSQPAMDGYSQAEVAALLASAKGKLAAQAGAVVEAEARELVDSCRLAWAGIDDGRETPYDPEELAALAQHHTRGVPGANAAERLRRVWVLVDSGGSSYVLTPGGYRRFADRQLHVAARAYLAPAQTAGVELYAPDAKGARSLRTWPQLTAEYATALETIRYRYEVPDQPAASGGVFHMQTRTLELPAGRMRDLTPQWDPQIHGWLTALAASEKGRAALQLWLSYAVDVDRPCAALFLVGAGSTGKSLLASGLSALWEQGVGSAEKTLVGRFNDELLRTPFVVADERLPTEPGAKGFDMETFRTFISARERSVEAKGRPTVALEGCVRLLATLQRIELLELHGDLTDVDFAAISERICTVHVAPEAAEYLRQIPAETLEAWARGGIARHVLALRERRIQHEEATGQSMAQGRFLVRMDSQADQRRLAARGGLADSLVEWIGRALGGQPDPMAGLHVVEAEGSPNGLAVATTANFIAARWSATGHADRVPRTGKIGRALATVSIGTRRVTWGNCSTAREHLVDGALVAGWLEAAGIADDGEGFLRRLVVPA